MKYGIKEIQAGQLHDGIELLQENSLPASDLATRKPYLIGYSIEDVLTAVCGLEIYGDAGLLRSLVVRKDNGSQGPGKILHDTIKEYSKNKHTKALYLLATSAEKYFEKLGWQKTGRDEVPDALKISA